MHRLPSSRIPHLALVGALSLATLVATAPRADACDDQAPEVHRSKNAIWCVNPGIWKDHQAEVEGFFEYGDRVIDQLGVLFGATRDPLPYTIELTEPNSGAMTPSNYGPGVAVTGDAIYNEFGGVVGYWGYLLILHEFINAWTGQISGGWPTDWWADHRSPFPNAMDEQVMKTIGQDKAAKVQHDRYNLKGKNEYDAQVVMFNDVFAKIGFDGLRHVFDMIRADGLAWGSLRDAPDFKKQTPFGSGNPSALLSSYVTAYLSLGTRGDLTASFVAAGVGARPPQWNDAQDGAWVRDTTPTSPAVTAIASAHCAIAAAAAGGGDAAALKTARAALVRGDYAHATMPAPASCEACPGECACERDTHVCAAPWNVTNPAPTTPDAGAGGGGSGGGGHGGGDAGLSDPSVEGGCGCASAGPASGGGALLLAAAVIAVTRRRRAR